MIESGLNRPARIGSDLVQVQSNGKYKGEDRCERDISRVIRVALPCYENWGGVKRAQIVLACLAGKW